MSEFLLCNFIEIILLHGWSPVNLLRFCRTPFLKNSYGGLPLDIYAITRNTVSCFLSLFSVIIHQFHSYTKNVTLIPFIPTPSSPHLHPDFSHSHPDSPHSHPYSPHSYLIPRISIIPFISFPNSPFRLLQIAFINGFKEKEIFYFKKIRQLPGEFFSFFVSLFRLGEIKLWLSLTMQQFDDFWKLLENMHWSACDGDYFW